MSKTTALILIILLIGGFYLASNLGYIDTLTSIINPNQEPTQTKPGYSMQVSTQLKNWIQTSTTNPLAQYTINITATNTQITQPIPATIEYEITNQNSTVKKGTIDLGIIPENQQKTITQNHEFQKGTYQATYTLKTQKIWDTFTEQFKIDLPREGLGDHVRFYITPNHPTIQNQLQTTTTDLNTIYNWVAKNIQYQYDSDIHETEEYWQFPQETLTLKTGDCEDQAFLLCSLIRASGTKVEDIFVALGTIENQGHAWVIIRTQLGWRTLEPTIDGITDRIITDIFEFLNTQGRHYYFASNDQYFEEINPTNSQSYINQQFNGWYKNNQKLNKTQITTKINQPLKLKINITNTGSHTYYGFIQIKIQKDIVMSPDQTLTTQTVPITLDPNTTQQLELTFTPDQITEETPLKCRQYYYKVSTCFTEINNPQDQNTRECIYITT